MAEWADCFISSKMAELDAAYYLRWNLRCMSVVAMWPSSSLAITLISYCMVFIIAVFYLSLMALTVSVRNDMNRLPICIGFLCGYFDSVYKWYRIVKCRKELGEVLTSLTETYKLGSTNDTSKTWKEAYQAAGRLSIIGTIGWLFYLLYLAAQNSLYPLSINGMKMEIPENNLEVSGITDVSINTGDVKEPLSNRTLSEKAYMVLYFLPLGDWPFLDTSSSPAYELAYFVQASGLIAHGIVHACTDTLFFALATLVCGQFKALIPSLKIVGTSSNDYSELLASIHHHQHLLRTVEMINTVFSPLMMVQFFNAMLALCTFAFEASKMEGDGLKMWAQAQLFLATVIQSYMFCSVGSQLTSLSLQVADSSYESDWIDKPKFWKQSIEIMMMRAQKPLKLIGGPFYVISKETFLALMQLSFSYYTVLRNVQEGEE